MLRTRRLGMRLLLDLMRVLLLSRYVLTSDKMENGQRADL